VPALPFLKVFENPDPLSDSHSFQKNGHLPHSHYGLSIIIVIAGIILVTRQDLLELRGGV
jgi:hypothetical protein